MQNKKQHGFTLVELAIVIAIVGVLLAMAAAFVLPIFEAAKRIETEEKMQRISRAMAFYTVRNLRLPCPAEPDRGSNNPPYGYERGSGANGAAVPADCGANAADWVGMIPFRTIGLAETDIIDGYGNAFTYAVSPAFALDTTDNTLDVHPRCRTREWYYQDGEELEDILHKNPVKARYCCPGEDVYAPGTDLQVNNITGNSVLAFTRNADNSAAVSMTGTAYEPTDQPFVIEANIFVPPDDRIEAVNYLILSHGRNGRGAFNLATGGQNPGAPGGSLEAENHDGDRVFNDIAREDDIPAGQEYDDLILWRTQDLILAENKDSCVVP